MLQPFSKQENTYHTRINQYIRKQYPLIDELFGDEGVQQITQKELNVTKGIYQNLPQTLLGIIQKNKYIAFNLLKSPDVATEDLVKIVSQMPNTHPIPHQIALKTTGQYDQTSSKK